MGDMTKNFSRVEFECACGCRSQNIATELVDLLQKVRDEAGIPMRITSGVRCPDHNARVGGVPASAHVPRKYNGKTVGLAADIECKDSRTRYKLLPAVTKHFPRVGDGDGFLHVDIDSSKPMYVLFNYYKD